ncbi:hypothetical protein WJX72_009084 [[Myrmecia] bisecta]|uniref:Uncharacterized protein n=1 Tax=[Myrmecia] bisecta TaxID=41462 RepID=A0AAW1QS38_9CHLO
MSSKLSTVKAAHVVPEVVDGLSSGDPTSLEVLYGGKAVSDGEEIPPPQAKHAPEVHIKGQGSDTKYSLLLTDPDAPDPEKPVNREWLHWLVVNIPPSGDLSKGEEVVPYMGPAPPIGVHRYVFSVFRQPGNVKVSKAPSRAKFSTRGFAAEHTLGDPAAVLFFRSRAPK